MHLICSFSSENLRTRSMHFSYVGQFLPKSVESLQAHCLDMLLRTLHLFQGCSSNCIGQTNLNVNLVNHVICGSFMSCLWWCDESTNWGIVLLIVGYNNLDVWVSTQRQNRLSFSMHLRLAANSLSHRQTSSKIISKTWIDGLQWVFPRNSALAFGVLSVSYSFL